MRIILDSTDETAIAKILAEQTKDEGVVVYDGCGKLPLISLEYEIFNDYETKFSINNVSCKQFADVYVECDYIKIERWATSFKIMNKITDKK